MLTDMKPLCVLVYLSWASASLAQTGQTESPGAPGGARVYHIGEDGVRPPTLISKNDPEFPSESCPGARKAAYGTGSTVGTVTVSLIVSRSGRAQEVKVIRPLGLGLDQPAVQAIRTWKFKPAMKDGAAVPVYGTIEVHFELPAKCLPK